jgi:uncharacterized DUF497 family protein
METKRGWNPPLDDMTLSRHCVHAGDRRSWRLSKGVRYLFVDCDDPDGNIQHIAEHGLDVEDVEWVPGAPEIAGVSKSSGRPVVWGHTPEGIYIIVVYEEIDEYTIRVITAYEVPESKKVNE